MILASDVSARISGLIERHHRGDRGAAAHRLGVNPHRLAGLLSGDWRQFSLDTMVALLVGYGVSPSWLLSAADGAEGGPDGLVPEGRAVVRPAAQALRCAPVRRNAGQPARHDSSPHGPDVVARGLPANPH